MKCPKCGNNLHKGQKFCSQCGKKAITEEKKIITSNFIAVCFISLVFIGLAIVIFTIVNQKSSNQQNGEVDLLLSEERVLDIRQQIQEIKNYEEKRLGGVSNKKPFADGDYQYDERTVDFRLVCSRPCTVPEDILDQEFAAISYAISTVRGLTQSDIDEEMMPFEVHAIEDDICPIVKGALAYMNNFTDKNGYQRGKLCFFFDKLPYNRDKFPYSTSIHEVMHLFQQNKLPPYSRSAAVIWEGLSEMMESFFLKGNVRDSFCWEGNRWWAYELGHNPHGPHDTGRDLFFALCNQYGFDYDDLPRLFYELDKKGGNIDEKEFVSIINSIVGKDTSYLFRKAGVIK